MTAFIFVASIFALERIGTRSIERVNVDARMLGALLFAAVVFFVQDSPASPYREPWTWSVRDGSDVARDAAADLLDDPSIAVRAPDSMVTELAEREEIYLLDTIGNPHVRRAAAGVDAIVFDAESAPDWDDDDRRRFADGLTELGFVETFADAGVSVFERET